jgi:uncharacterized protein involved in exopolysaccharide biosynthesis
MKQWVRLATRIYPAAWRRRYGAEFDALVEDASPGWRDVFDVLWGAVTMQVSMWSFRNAMAACGLLGLLIAAGWSFSVPKQYVSHAVLRMTAMDTQNPDAVSDQLNVLVQQVLSRNGLSKIVLRPDLNLYAADRTREPLEDVIEKMKKQGIRIDLLKTDPHTTSFAVSFTYPDPVLAQKTTSALITSLVDANFKLAAGTRTSLDLLDPASLPQKSPSSRWPILFVGLTLGVAAGILAVGVRRWPVVVLTAAAAPVLAAAASFLLPDVYVSRAALRASNTDQLPGLIRQVVTDDFLKDCIARFNLYAHSRSEVPIDELMRKMRKDLRFEMIPAPRPRAVVISFTSADRFAAQSVAAYVQRSLVAAAGRAGPAATSLQLLDPASLPVTPAAPNRMAIAELGFAIGLVGAVLTLWLRHRRTPVLNAA